MFKFNDCYISYVNLGHRSDRFHHMNAQLDAAGIKAVRTDGVMPHEIQFDAHKHRVMWERTKGALGCWTAQVNIMKEALRQNKSAVVFEDDCIFCSDIQERISHIEKFIDENDPDFDVVWLGGTVHVNPSYWHGERNMDSANSRLGQDAQVTSDPRMLRTLGAFSTYAYIVNVKSLQKIINSLDAMMHESMGIDWAFIKMQPNLRTYMYVPGCVKQMDNQSDIGGAMTVFSNFSSLGPYWWQDKASDFDAANWNWAEANNKVIAEADKPVLNISAPELGTNISYENFNLAFGGTSCVTMFIEQQEYQEEKPKKLDYTDSIITRQLEFTIKNTSKDTQKIKLFNKAFHGFNDDLSSIEGYVNLKDIGITIEGYSSSFMQIFSEIIQSHGSWPYVAVNINIISDNIYNLLTQYNSVSKDSQNRTFTIPLNSPANYFGSIEQKGHLYGLTFSRYQFPLAYNDASIEFDIVPFSSVIMSIGVVKK